MYGSVCTISVLFCDSIPGDWLMCCRLTTRGEHRLEQWLDFPESGDDELLTERIPFAETRDYVRIVQQNAQIYRLAYQKIATN